MSTKLVNGDVAELKSGGPKMTVVKEKVPEGSKFVQVAWFNGAILSHETFPREALKGHPEKPVEAVKPDASKAEPAKSDSPTPAE